MTSSSVNRSPRFKKKAILTLRDTLRLYCPKGGINTHIRDVLKDILYLPMAFQNYHDEIPDILSLFYVVS